MFFQPSGSKPDASFACGDFCADHWHIADHNMPLMSSLTCLLLTHFPSYGPYVTHPSLSHPHLSSCVPSNSERPCRCPAHSQRCQPRGPTHTVSLKHTCMLTRWHSPLLWSVWASPSWFPGVMEILESPGILKSLLQAWIVSEVNKSLGENDGISWTFVILNLKNDKLLIYQL